MKNKDKIKIHPRNYFIILLASVLGISALISLFGNPVFAKVQGNSFGAKLYFTCLFISILSMLCAFVIKWILEGRTKDEDE